jgi:hypothetical protein
MVDRSRLDLYEEIAGPMRRSPRELRVGAARVAAEWAVSRASLTDPAVVSAMNGGSLEPLDLLCDSLVERHYELFQARCAGLATEKEVSAAWNSGRAADAVRHLMRGEPEEAIFEAIPAAVDWTELRELLLSMLHKD